MYIQHTLKVVLCSDTDLYLACPVHVASLNDFRKFAKDAKDFNEYRQIPFRAVEMLRLFRLQRVRAKATVMLQNYDEFSATPANYIYLIAFNYTNSTTTKTLLLLS